MRKAQFGGMEKIAGKANRSGAARPDFTWRSVEGVADDGMSQEDQVHADLVSPSGIDLTSEQSELAVGGLEAAKNA